VMQARINVNLKSLTREDLEARRHELVMNSLRVSHVGRSALLLPTFVPVKQVNSEYLGEPPAIAPVKQ
jgi:hypothetical protein